MATKLVPIDTLRKRLHSLVRQRIVEEKIDDPKIAEKYSATVAELARRTKRDPKTIRTGARRKVRAIAKDLH
jgi:hypothetical protein